MNAYSDFGVGDKVYCLAWVGKKFEIVSKDDSQQLIRLQGDRENIPWGAQVDILPSRLWMLTDKPWDEVWYWPDRSGESYMEVFKRFVKAHSAGEIITGYRIGDTMTSEAITADRAMAHRIVMIDEVSTYVEPVVGFIEGTGEPIKEATLDPAVHWVSAGPISAAKVRMMRYRWAVTCGDIVLNWVDFTPCDWMKTEMGN